MISPIYFLICNLFINLLLGWIMLLQKLLKKHMTVHLSYHLWHVFVFVLFIPFIPGKLIFSGQVFLWIQEFFSSETMSSAISLSPKGTAAQSFSQTAIEDFSAAVSSSGSYFNQILGCIWLAGIILTTLYFLYTLGRIYLLRKYSRRITVTEEPELYAQFTSCLRELRFKRNVRLYASCSIQSPVSYGWLKPTVIIPEDLDIVSSPEELRFIFLHELQHHRQQDALFNALVCLLEIFYWFNPFIWFGFYHFQKEREIACDHSVIRVIGEELCGHYGLTIIRCADRMKKGVFLSPLSAMGGNQSEIKRRIAEIANYKTYSFKDKIKSMGVFLLLLTVILSVSPFLNAYAAASAAFPIDSNKWKSIDVSSSFQGNTGSFVLYDVRKDYYYIYNQPLSQKRISPDSTFKIYSGLFALEEGLITPESSAQLWNQAPQPYTSWEKNQNLQTAMNHSVNWYFQNLDKKMGAAALYSYYRRISYGNCDLSGGTDSYWAESTLKISPAEQVQLLAGLLSNSWNFQPENIKAVKDAMVLSQTPDRTLYGKTGTGFSENQQNGWFIGFIETADNTYCFAVNLQDSSGKKNVNGNKAAKIALSILDNLSLL